MLVSAIVANGGHEIVVTEHGNLGEGLTRLPHGALAQLRRNGWIESVQAGGGTRVGLWPRTREIAAQWGIELPAPTDADA